MKILVGQEEMTSKERIRATLAFAPTDRVPIDYSGNPGINQRLREYLEVDPQEPDGLQRALGVDFRRVAAPYTGARLHAEVPDRHVDAMWGWHTRYVEHDSGSYWDYCDFPLAAADEGTIAAWPMPDPDDFDYSVIPQRLEALSGYGVHVGGAGLACIMNTAGFLRTMQQVFIDLATDDPAGLLLVDRMLDIQYEITRRELEAAAGGVDFMWIGEDLGTQNGPLISMKTFRRHIRPRHQRFIDLAKAHNLPVMIHTCGSSSWAYEDYIEMGVRAVDTLQPEAGNMAPAYLKETFGGRLAFHGCISTAGPVAYGNVADTVRNVQETLAIMMPGGGYCFSPTHCLQDNTPTANAVAMYEAAHRYGRY